METPVMSLFSKVVSFGFLASTLVTGALEKSMGKRRSRTRRALRTSLRGVTSRLAIASMPPSSRVLRAARSALVTLLMLGMCAVGHTAPRTGHHKAAPHPDMTILNTTLPVPEITAPGGGRHDLGRHMAPAGSHVLARIPAADGATDRGAADRANEESAAGNGAKGEGASGERANGTFPIHWRESREIVGPEFVSRIRNYHRDGLPVVQLWESQQSRVSIGVTPHGLPGIYFTHHVGG